MSKYALKNEEGSERAALYIYGEIVNDAQASIYHLFGIDGVVELQTLESSWKR